jgi:hypothetical protein
MNASSSTERPGFWKLLWMFHMQPILLENVSQDDLVKRSNDFRQARKTTRLLPFGLIVLVSVGTYFVASSRGIAVNLYLFAFVVAVGLAFCEEFGSALAVLFAALTAAVTGWVGDVSDDAAFWMTILVAIYFLFIGMPVVISAEDDDSEFRFLSRVLSIIAGGVSFCVALGMALGPVGVLGGIVSIGTGWIAAAVGLPMFFQQILTSLVAFSLSLLAPVIGRIFRKPAVTYSPVRFLDSCHLPLIGLERHIVEAATDAPALIRDTLEACQRSKRQQTVGETALAILKTREFRQLIVARSFDDATKLEGEWLGGIRDGDERLQSLAEASRYLRAADQSRVQHKKVQQIERALQSLANFRNRLLTDRTYEAREFLVTLESAESVAKTMRQGAVELARDQLPNAFRAGDPLQPEIGEETFRGRDDLVRRVELLLNDDRQSVAVAVLAPRRCGKSSLLRMLPVKLPDALCVFFDLQDNPVSTPLDFFPALARRTVEQARQQHRGDVPELTDPTLEAARDWLDALENRPGQERVLLCLDEFERLEEVVDEKPETKQQLVQLMGLLRATIQHRRRVRILVAGNATFDELGPLWNDTFISAQELRLGPLERETAINLLRQPIPSSEIFPEDTVPRDVAEAIVELTGGQPYLTQLYGFWLVEELNLKKCKQAMMSDVETVSEKVCDQAGTFFRDCIQPRGATFEVRPIMEQIVAGETPELTASQTRFLIRRGLITAEGELAFPILAKWLNEYAE